MCVRERVLFCAFARGGGEEEKTTTTNVCFQTLTGKYPNEATKKRKGIFSSSTA